MKIAIVLLAVLAVAQAFSTKQFSPTAASFQEWMCLGGKETCLDGTEEFDVLRARFMKRAMGFITDAVRTKGHGLPREVAEVAEAIHAMGEMDTHSGGTWDAMKHLIQKRHKKLEKEGRDPTTSYPFFGFLPKYHTSVIPGGPIAQYSTPCFTNVTVSASKPMNGNVTLKFDLVSQTSFLCTDFLLLASGPSMKIEGFLWPQQKTIEWNVTGVKGAQLWDLENKGIRVFRFNRNIIDVVLDVIETVLLFRGFVENPVDDFTADINIYFLDKYTNIKPFMGPRKSGAYVARNLDPTYIQSGDIFAVVRLDGVDTMLAWPEGSNVGHSTIAMRNTSGHLHVCESTTHDAYWPTNGIQCHPWDLWVQLAAEARYNVVLLPLAPKYKKMFNTAKAWEFFNENAGINYGYHNLLFGWLDTENDNYPCLPPNYDTCLEIHLVELIATVMDSLSPKGSAIFRQALNQRTKTMAQGLTVLEVIQYAKEKMNMDMRKLVTIVEDDSWRYNISRNGKPSVGRSMVCDVFVCHMWKAAGVFSEIDSEINCGEQDLWDLFSMKVFDTTKMYDGRPKICRDHDPTNQFCQIIGNFTVNLALNVNERTPYKNMGNHCPSKNPDYIRPAGC